MIEQRSDEWFKLRLGKVTASRIADVCARTKTGRGASRANYMAELVAERLTGVPAARYVSAEMQRGTDLEPEAIAAYEWHQDATVEPVGFVEHPRVKMTGASPDGLIGKHGLIEVKCPNTATHIDTLLGGSIADRYLQQMEWQMAVTGRQWCDFVSYDPRLPDDMRLFVQRVERDEKLIAALEAEVVEFLGELDEKVAALWARYGKPAPIRMKRTGT